MLCRILKRLPGLLLPLFVLAASAARPLMAQHDPHVTVALVPRLADSAVATIIRVAGSDGRMLVLLRERDADAITLSSAMMALFEVRHVLGDTARSRIVLKVYGIRTPESIGPNEQQLADYHLRRLRAAKPAPLDSLGLVKAVDVPIVAERIAVK